MDSGHEVRLMATFATLVTSAASLKTCLTVSIWLTLLEML
jgi:hypothetical protein